jgi:hypothetical protein
LVILNFYCWILAKLPAINLICSHQKLTFEEATCIHGVCLDY